MKRVLIILTIVSAVVLSCSAQTLEELSKKATAGDVATQVKLGDMYALGNGVPRSMPSAAKWYRLAADAGNAEAQTKLAMMLEIGFGVPKDPKQAMELFQKASANGNSAADMRLATAYETGRDVPKNGKLAIKYYEKAAEAGVIKAQLKLGQLLRDGFDNVQHDYAASLAWFRKAADAKDPEGEYQIGVAYEQGYGVPVSTDEAIKWYKIAANQGSVNAKASLHNLGVSPN